LKNKITIITPTYNSAKTILTNITSVKNQKYQNFEHIIVDNNSNDQTLNLIKKNINKNIRIITEKDKGIYDAINKGIKLAQGEIISILHSDDIYYDNETLSKVVESFGKKNTDIVYGDLLYVSKYDLNNVIRYWKSGKFRQGLFMLGWSPPHPSFFIKKKIHNKFGYYNIKIGNPADIELMYRFLELKKVNSKYINKVLIKMRYGGKSNNSIIEIFRQNVRILNFLHLRSPFKIIKFIYFKILDRMLQLINTSK
tara:strand:+ start:1183 stop:1944 length:762 start_codon:yes stop_codon:yes gene_type:complete